MAVNLIAGRCSGHRFKGRKKPNDSEKMKNEVKKVSICENEREGILEVKMKENEGKARVEKQK